MKSPGTSPERKKPKVDLLPMEVRSAEEREINPTHLLNYTTALSGFETPTEEQLVTVSGDAFRHHPNEDVEQYFRASSQWGVPAIAWNIVRPAFLWKLEFCITEFMNVEKKRKEEAAAAAAAQKTSKSPESPGEKGEKEKEKGPETPVKERLSILHRLFPGQVNLIKTTPVEFRTDESIEFVLDKAKSFDGFPFTWQRLCELLIEPTRHYNTLDKFLRAIEKVINVVTTINENGSRNFGDWELPSNAPHHLESVFFGAVDEVEAMEMEEKQQQKELEHKKSGDFSTSSSSSSSTTSSSSTSPDDQPLDMSQKSTTSMPAPFAPPTAPNAPNAPKNEEIIEEEMPEEEPKKEQNEEKND